MACWWSCCVAGCSEHNTPTTNVAAGETRTTPRDTSTASQRPLSSTNEWVGYKSPYASLYKSPYSSCYKYGLSSHRYSLASQNIAPCNAVTNSKSDISSNNAIEEVNQRPTSLVKSLHVAEVSQESIVKDLQELPTSVNKVSTSSIHSGISVRSSLLNISTSNPVASTSVINNEKQTELSPLPSATFGLRDSDSGSVGSGSVSSLLSAHLSSCDEEGASAAVPVAQSSDMATSVVQNSAPAKTKKTGPAKAFSRMMTRLRNLSKSTKRKQK